MKTIADFEVVDHGIEHEQYFCGCGVAFTPFAEVVTGAGSDPAEAIDDCLEQMATIGWETENMEARIMEQEGLERLPEEPATHHDDMHYYVSIRWNGR